MSDLINRQDAIDCFWDENRMMRDWLDIIKDIRSLPSVADVVEIVRCKDCKYKDTCCRMIRNEKKPNDYCSFGERREDEQIHCFKCDC